MDAVLVGVRRRVGIDVARILALVVVVMGHLALAVVDRAGGDLRGANLLALRPGWAWIAVLAPMPVFFAAGGWANATATPETSAARLRSLVGLGAVVVAAWSTLVVATTVLTGDAGVVAQGARIATQPLWFLAAYVPLAAWGGALARLAARRPAAAVGSCLAALTILDVGRFALGGPDWIAWPAFYAAWGVPWVLGAWWRHRVETPELGSFNEQRAGAALLVTAGAAGAALVSRNGYSPALIDAVPRTRSNTTPPTLYTAVTGVAQVGGLMLGAGALDRLGDRWRRLWAQAGEAAVGIYVWHLTALALAVAVLAAGIPAPERLTGLWWATRPLWWTAVLAITAGLLLATRRALAPDARTTPRVSGAGTPAGIVLATIGAALVGLEGPTTVRLAVTCSALFVGAWRLLR